MLLLAITRSCLSNQIDYPIYDIKQSKWAREDKPCRNVTATDTICSIVLGALFHLILEIRVACYTLEKVGGVHLEIVLYVWPAHEWNVWFHIKITQLKRNKALSVRFTIRLIEILKSNLKLQIAWQQYFDSMTGLFDYNTLVK